MTISMYQASAPRFVHTLNALSTIMDKGQAFADARKVDVTVLTSARLFPDMFNFARQVMIVTDTAKGAAARLAGVEIPKYEDTEQTFAELRARIEKTVAFVNTLTPAQIDGSEEREITLKLGGKDTKFTGLQYLLGFVLPNFYFHATTAYDILRSNGVELAKRDFLGAV